jgi:hypothetical protein
VAVRPEPNTPAHISRTLECSELKPDLTGSATVRHDDDVGTRNGTASTVIPTRRVQAHAAAVNLPGPIKIG